MVQYHKAFKTKLGGTGGKKHSMRDKKRAHYGGFFSKTKLVKEGKEDRDSFRTKGGSRKVAALNVGFVNVADGKTIKKVKITNVVQTPDNRHFSRENVITKGAIIETELGKAKVTSRPGQSGVINAVLVKA